MVASPSSTTGASFARRSSLLVDVGNRMSMVSFRWRFFQKWIVPAIQVRGSKKPSQYRFLQSCPSESMMWPIGAQEDVFLFRAEYWRARISPQQVYGIPVPAGMDSVAAATGCPRAWRGPPSA